MVAGSHALAAKFLTLTGLGGEHIIILCVYPEPVSSCSLIINTRLLQNCRHKPSAPQHSGGGHVWRQQQTSWWWVATAAPIISERISERQESGKHWLLPSLIKRRDVIVVCSLVSADISNEFSRVLQSVPRSENPWIPISNPYLNLRYAFLH